MEESKELQGFYKIFRAVVYVSVLLEFFEYAIDPAVFDQWGGILTDIHGRIKRWTIYQDGHLVYSKIATILLICITCIGTRNKKHLEFNARKQVIFPLTGGLLLLVLSVWLFGHPMEMRLYTLPLNRILYMAASLVGVILVHIALDNISKFIKEGLMKDRFNFENESFEQSEEIQENKYSVNIPMRYYYKGKFRKGWVSISNPFRGTWVVGTPGSGKTFSIIEPFIRQHSAKGFAMVVYDYKFPTLATKLYYHYKLNEKLGRVPKGCKFNMINFVDVEYSRRVNPIQAKYINNLAAASETAETLLESLQKGKKEGGGGSDQFFQTSAVNFLAACIYFFVNYEREPYDKDGNMLYAEKRQDPETKFWKPTGVVRDKEGGNIVEPAYWLGKYSDMPHILSFLNESYQTIFEVLETDNEVAPLLGPFQTAFRNKAMEQLEGMIGTLRVYTSRLATKESYWIFHRDGDDFDLKVSDPKNPSYLLIANDPEMESIIGALNALILNRLVTRVNTGQGKNIPVSIIVDELPTLYFHKIDRLIGTARSNKVSVTLGFQELPQLEADYGKVGMQKIITTVGNVVSGSARSKETLEWLSNDMFVYMPINALYPLITMECFNGTPMHISITEIAYASGMLIGGLLLGLFGNYQKRILLITASIFMMGISLTISGLLPQSGFFIFVVCCAIMGLSVPFYSGVQTALFQEKIKPEYLGRVFSLTGSIMSLAMPIGLILSGFFADRIGVNHWFLLSGILIICIAIVCPMITEIRKLDAK